MPICYVKSEKNTLETKNKLLLDANQVLPSKHAI